MNWINTAILSTAVFAIMNILDSHLISRRMLNFQVHLLLKAFFYIIYDAVLLYLFPIPAGASLSAILIGFGSSLTRFIGITIMIYIMTKEDISQIIPMAFIYPVFVAIIAFPLLGETLHYLQWMAIIIVVSGAIMVSVKRIPSEPLPFWAGTFLFYLGLASCSPSPISGINTP